MGGVIGLDVGGANTKAVWRDGDERRVASRPFEVWRDRDALAGVLREVIASLGKPEAVALTMTAELSDAFRSKREGVNFVLDAAEDALAGTRLVVLSTLGELLAVEQARERPLEIAAANWMASARVVAAHFPEALMIDAGGTTVDLIPIAGGAVVVRGRTDLDRLMAGELVYTGVMRTNLASIAGHVPVRGDWCPVASELFAISADVHLILGHIAPDEYTCPTPDGRPGTLEYARERVARLVCADAEQLTAAEIDAIAAYLHSEQVRTVEHAARDAASELTAFAPVVPLGSGAFLAREVAERLGVGVRDLPWSEAERSVAPAAALAELASELRARC
jgi:probable H4MPT-linked C1 transfer pathway protein